MANGDFSKKSKNKPISKMGFTRWGMSKRSADASSTNKGYSGGGISAGTSRTARPMKRPPISTKKEELPSSSQNPRNLGNQGSSIAGLTPSQKLAGEQYRRTPQMVDKSQQEIRAEKIAKAKLQAPKKQFFVAKTGIRAKSRYGKLPKVKVRTMAKVI